jgi:hypothetical protein
MIGKFFTRKSKQCEPVDSPVVLHGISSELNYCPVCGDEYRADRIICAACDQELISGREKLAQIEEKEQLFSSRSMELSPDDELVILRKGPLKDIKQLQKLLAKERIPGVLAGDEQSCGKGCCGPEIYLQIRKNDVEPAMAVLSQDFIKSTALSSHDMTYVDAVYVQGAESTDCPACGCRFSPSVEKNCPECGLCLG